MPLAILGIIGPALGKLLGVILDIFIKKAEKKQAYMDNFYKLMVKIGMDPSIAAGLNASYASQQNKNKEELNKP